ncbi:hypothetical protein [Psychrobacillus phage Perkons]|nr:hypothetical protein [Psychrobacillus phage Perkons]
MARLQNTFEFVGNLNFGEKPVKSFEYDSGWNKKQLSVSINESQSNGAFLSLDAYFHPAKPNKVVTFSKSLFGEKGGKIELAWADRFNQSNIDSVPDYKKVVIDLTEDVEAKEKYQKLRGEIYNLETKEEPTAEDRQKLGELYKSVRETVPLCHEFLHSLDAIEFIEQHSAELKGKKFRAKGSIDMRKWKDKFYTNYTMQSLELVSEDEPSKLSVRADLYYTKDAIDKSGFKSEQTILFDTYILAYDSGHKADKLFPFRTIFNGKKYDFTNPKHQSHMDIVEKFMTVKKKGVYHLPFDIKIVRGAEEKEFSEEQLTDEQKMMIDLGFNTAKDFQTGGKVFGDRIEENRLAIPLLKQFGGENFSKGSLESNYNEDDLVYIPAESNYTPKTESKVEPTDTTSSSPFDFDENDLPF